MEEKRRELKKHYISHVQLRSKYNQALPVCRQLCITSMVFWHVGGNLGNYRKRGDPSTSVMQWEYSSLLFRAVKLTLRLHFTACCPLHTLPSAAEPPHVHIYSKHTQTHTFMFLHTVVNISYLTLISEECEPTHISHMRAHVQK